MGIFFSQRTASHPAATSATTVRPASGSPLPRTGEGLGVGAIPPRWHGVIAPTIPPMAQEQWEETVRWLARRYSIVAHPASRIPSARGVYLYAAETLPGWRTAFLPRSSPAYQAYCSGKPCTVYVSRRDRTISCTCALAQRERHLCGHVGAVLLALLREEAE